jgi:hypothetical protein
MPRREAAATSMVLKPAPARTMSFKGPASSIGSVTFVERTTRMSGRKCATASVSESSFASGWYS